jgi:fatty-acyl-CoA synthase
MKFEDRLPFLNSYIEMWAEKRPEKAAMIQHEDGKTISYKKFATLIDFFALKLLDMGIVKGDILATQLVLIPEHMVLMYACFKIGAIIAPLDLRLQDHEVVRDIEKIQPKAFFFLGNTPVRDFRTAGSAVKKECPSVKHLVQFTPDPKPGDVIESAIAITELMTKGGLLLLKIKDIFTGRLKKAYGRVQAKTPALIIFTTGTTGEPKPAMLSHENIIVQNQILSRGMGMGTDDRGVVLVNLPPSHVGCVTETFMTTLFLGGTTILLRIFDVKLTLEAIEKHKVEALGQIPTQFRMLWNHPDHDNYDLSSLKFVAYGGSSVDIGFLERLAKMAPRFGTGLGMTESAGFATFTPDNISIEEMAGQVGRAYPDLAGVSIRKPMDKNGNAGEELEDGEIGEICYHPPIVFSGYYNQPEATAETISTEGILYSGDLGYFRQMTSYRALYLSGRRKFVIKQKGYNIFPGEVEAHIAALEGVETAEVIGKTHSLFDEAVFAFVLLEKGARLTPESIKAHCNSMASYKRPHHIEIWPADKEFPITRSTKVDKLALSKIAEEIIERLRSKGGWDQ